MAIDTQQLNDEIRTFVVDTTNVRGAVLATYDGLPLASALPKALEESRAAAMAAAVFAIGDRIGTELQRGQMQHVTLASDRGYSILTRCGHESLFFVLASSDVKQGILLLEIRRIVTQLTGLLGEPLC